MSFNPQSVNQGFVLQTKLKIVGDIGGTNARFACVTDEGNYYHKVQIYACADFETLGDALQAYIEFLQDIPELQTQELGEVCLAIAGPVYNDIIDLPNNHWTFSRTKLQRTVGVPVQVINDFTAQTLCLDLLAEDELLWFDDARPTGNRIRAVVGPGTGLGVAIQMPDGTIIPSEGGHIGFAPKTDHQIEILKLLWQKRQRISVERLLSGMGLENLYWANSVLMGSEKTVTAPEVLKLAQQGDELSLTALKDFFDVLACFTGDIALTAWAADGIYLSGGILPKVWEFFDTQKFRTMFQAKGRFSDFCRTVPLALVTAEQPGLLGCVAAVQKSGQAS